MKKQELEKILEEHKKWLDGNGGKKADLNGVDLNGANLCGADLYWANLYEADLRWANLYEADLSEANLHGADLSGTCLSETLLNKTNLANTILDPKNILSNPSIFEIEKAGMQVSDDGKYILAWRTCKSMYVGNTQYDLGTYEAPVFSSCTETECHPGLYFASKEWLIKHYCYNNKEVRLVQVRVPIENNVVHAGDKWRCRKFEVLGKIE